MSNRAIYTIMAVVVVGALVGLWFVVQGGGDGAVADGDHAKGSGSAGGFTPSHTGPANGPVRPQLAGGSAPMPAKVQEYASNGAIVHDHRTGTHETYDVPENTAPANGGRMLQPQLTGAIADKVRDAMHACVKQMGEGGKGADPRLEGRINISIKNKQASINTADLEVRDVSADVAQTTKACIVGKTLASSPTASGDEADLVSYDINVSFNLL